MDQKRQLVDYFVVVGLDEAKLQRAADAEKLTAPMPATAGSAGSGGGGGGEAGSARLKRGPPSISTVLDLPSRLDYQQEFAGGGAGNVAPARLVQPIYDIAVIFPRTGEKPPPGFTPITKTPSGWPADANHGKYVGEEVYVCINRGGAPSDSSGEAAGDAPPPPAPPAAAAAAAEAPAEAATGKTAAAAWAEDAAKRADAAAAAAQGGRPPSAPPPKVVVKRLPPIAEVRVVFHDKDPPLPAGWTRVGRTPDGHDANLNLGSGGRQVYLAYRRAPLLHDRAPGGGGWDTQRRYRTEHCRALVDLCVINRGKEGVPPGFALLPRNLNAGSWGGGSKMHLCARRAAPTGPSICRVTVVAERSGTV